MKVIGRMMTRGFGSNLRRKNAYPILGKPMLWWTLTEAKKAGFIDEIFVWTEDEELGQITTECNCHVIPRTRDQLFYYGGFEDVNSWYELQDNYILSECGSLGDVQVFLNCNLCLLTAKVWEEMFQRLTEDESATGVFPIGKVAPGLYMKNLKTGALFPIYADPTLRPQDFPDLYRIGGSYIFHAKRAKKIRRNKNNIYHEVEPELILDVHNLNDVKLAEYYLMRRLEGKVVIPEPQDEKIVSIRAGT